MTTSCVKQVGTARSRSHGLKGDTSLRHRKRDLCGKKVRPTQRPPHRHTPTRHRKPTCDTAKAGRTQRENRGPRCLLRSRVNSGLSHGLRQGHEAAPAQLPAATVVSHCGHFQGWTRRAHRGLSLEPTQRRTEQAQAPPRLLGTLTLARGQPAHVASPQRDTGGQHRGRHPTVWSALAFQPVGLAPGSSSSGH